MKTTCSLAFGLVASFIGAGFCSADFIWSNGAGDGSWQSLHNATA